MKKGIFTLSIVKGYDYCRGFNVYPREVEEVLFAHNNIVEAAVVGFPDPNLGKLYMPTLC